MEIANDRSLELDNLDSDDEYENQSDDETEDGDDELTILKDEVKIRETEMREEVAALEAEADLPLEEILKAYSKKTTRCTGFLAGSKTLEITDYSITKKVIKTGNYIPSDTFSVGGYQWEIEFYPQGRDSSFSDFISVGVRLINPTNDFQAISRHRFHDWNTSTWSPDTGMGSSLYTFSSSYTGCCIHIRRSDFETSSYLRNDILVIKTNLWVAKDISR